jgi:dienelactone hydrolase
MKPRMRVLAVVASAAVLVCQEPDTVFTPGSVAVDGVTLPYQLLQPKALRAGERLPLVVFLHGAGERGDDNRKQLTWLVNDLAQPALAKRYRCFVLAVQCPADRMWVDVPWADAHSRAMAKEPSLPLRAVIEAMHRVEDTLPVDRDRVYLTGLSMGGYGCWELAMRDPFHFAAAVPVCGGGDEKQCHRLLGVPVWVWHGDQDLAVPVERSRSMVAALRALGQPVQYTELPGVGHDSWKQAYGDGGALDWLFAQDRKAMGRDDGNVRYGVVGAHDAEAAPAKGEFAATAAMRVVAPPEHAALGEALAVELRRLLGAAVPVVDGVPRSGDVQLSVSSVFDLNSSDEVVHGRVTFDAVATIYAHGDGDLAAAAGSFVQALGSRAGLRAPFGRFETGLATDVGLALEDPKGTLPPTALAEALRRCWLFGVGNLFVTGAPSAELVAAGRDRGVVVQDLGALPAAHVQVLRVEASTADELIAALRVALPRHRERPSSAEELAGFHARLVRAARATGW